MASLSIVLLTSLLPQTAAVEPYQTCNQIFELYQARSSELAAIAKADQDDRPNNVMSPGAEFRDRARRKRVGEIFGEGCFKTAKDFAAAAIVYQHGDVPEHYYQTFLWSKRAVELGDPTQKVLMAYGIDRYLVNVGHKQLFGSQAWKFNVNQKCWCLRAVEPSFPETIRKQYLDLTLADQLNWVDSLNADLGCAPAKFCAEDITLKSSPAGTVPGFW